MKYFRQMINGIREWYQPNEEGHLEEADAIVLEFHSTGYIKNGMSEARLLLQVMPRTGRNYVTECHTFFAAGHPEGLYTGAKTKIYIHPNDPSKIHWSKSSNVNGET